MLGRLLKYELKATGRIFLPLYAALMLFAAVTKIISHFSGDSFNVPKIISIIMYCMLLTGMFVMTFVVMIQRFYKNLLSEEGYLMFTLPVESWKHIISKLAVSILWHIGSVVAALLSIIILAFEEVFLTDFLQEFFSAVSWISDVFGRTAGLAVMEIIFLSIISMASGILIIYASIALGHLANRHRVMASLGAFLGISTLSQILYFCIIVAVDSHELGKYLESLNVGLHTSVVVFHWAMWFMIGFFALLSVVYFIITDYILNRRLNLE